MSEKWFSEKLLYLIRKSHKTKGVMYKFRVVPVILVAALILVSCRGGKKGMDVSSTTGWEYNNPDNGGFEVVMGAEQITGPGLVLIEGGRFTMGQGKQGVLFGWN